MALHATDATDQRSNVNGAAAIGSIEEVGTIGTVGAINAVGAICDLSISLDEIECETGCARKSVFVTTCFNVQHLLSPGGNRVNQFPHVVLGVVGVQQQSHSVLSLTHNGKHNVTSIDAVPSEVESQVQRVLLTRRPERHDVSNGCFVPASILMNWDVKYPLLVGFLVDRVRCKRIQIEQGELVQIITSLWSVSLDNRHSNDNGVYLLHLLGPHESDSSTACCEQRERRCNRADEDLGLVD